MRTGGTFEVQAMPPHEHHLEAAAQAAATGWKSPVPYLFGGLAAMLGLIAFALLILACSYWKLSGYLDPADGESGDAGADGEKPKDSGSESVFMKSILVIMPGDEKPTRLATPSAATSRASSFGDEGKAGCSSGGEGEEKEEERREKVVELGGIGGGSGSGDDDDEGKS